MLYITLNYVRRRSVSSTNNIDRHGITEMLLKVALNTITLQPLCLIVVKKGQHLMSF